MENQKSKGCTSVVAGTIQRLTSASSDNADLKGISGLVDLIQSQPLGSRDAARTIRKQLKYGNTHQQMRTLDLLNGLVQSSESRFRLDLFDEPLLERLRVCGSSNSVDPVVKEKCTDLFEEWSRWGSSAGSESNVITRLRKELPQRKGAMTQKQSKAVQETKTPFDASEEEEARRGAAPEIESNLPKPGTVPKPGQWYPSFGPAYDRCFNIKPSDAPNYLSKKERDNKHATKLEDNRRATIEVKQWALKHVVKQSSIVATRLINSSWSLDRERERISQNKTIMQDFQACKQLRRRALHYINEADDAHQLSSLLHANQELIHALMTFEELDKSIDPDSDSDSNPFDDVNVVQIPERGRSDSR